jgi:hypothetical protein
VKNGKFCSQLSTYFKRHVAFKKADEFFIIFYIIGGAVLSP